MWPALVVSGTASEVTTTNFAFVSPAAGGMDEHGGYGWICIGFINMILFFSLLFWLTFGVSEEEAAAGMTPNRGGRGASIGPEGVLSREARSLAELTQGSQPRFTRLVEEAPEAPTATSAARAGCTTSAVAPAPEIDADNGPLAAVLEFRCPITLVTMVDPVIAADGHSYERAALEAWLANHRTSPFTGAPLEHMHVTPNHRLRSMIESAREVAASSEAVA